MNKLKITALILGSLGASALMSGCGSDTAVDHSYEQKGLDTVAQERKIFNSTQGDWDKLSPADQAAFTKAAGGDPIISKAAWLGMKSGPAAAQQYLRDNGRLH